MIVTHNIINCVGQPILPELIAFPTSHGIINIPERISVRYQEFGTLLLEDSTGARIRNIIHDHRTAERINWQILSEWLEGKGKQPVTWETLANSLDEAGIGELAKSIRESKDISARS